MVYRVYVEKKAEFAKEAKALLNDINSFLGLKGITKLRVLNRYDVENIDSELFEKCRAMVFYEPQTDNIFDELPQGDAAAVFAYEALPGQFDQRADSAAQCIQLISRGERPLVRTARVLLLYGSISPEELETVKKYVINPVESCEAELSLPRTLAMTCDIPGEVPVLNGFIKLDESGLEAFLKEYGLAMDLADLKCCREYFAKEKRDPTLTEIKVLDTYWSDHCRHTTFLTAIDEIEIDSELAAKAFERYQSLRQELGRKGAVTLMDIATMGMRYLKRKGKLEKLDESDEINACTVKIDVDVDGAVEEWLLLFKNETHNHPTEIEPFGGAATCIGGAIRDPLSGRSYVYQAMRVSGGANPLRPVEETIKGKLPQRKLVTTAAEGYSSYGNQVGLATGLVDEIYHDGYAAKHMEIGMVVGAAPRHNVIREKPAPGDIVVLLGGRTGRDGLGGATGSSKAHDITSLGKCGAEVQKGNAPEERKLQRLFRNPEATRLIKRCNDFGAGGVSVAIGELADGLMINLDTVPKKYEGLDGTELAISESQERMAVVLSPKDLDKFMQLAHDENLEVTPVATVTAEPRLVMHFNGRRIVDISREFLSSNGAQKHARARIGDIKLSRRSLVEPKSDFAERLKALCGDLNVCSKRGLSERFDSTIGAGTVLMPFGGSLQRTPAQAMVAKIPVLFKSTSTCSAAAYGFNPYISEQSPYHGAYLAVVEAISKLVATGADISECYLTLQEYFRHLGTDPDNWGQPLAALLGALNAQLDFEIAAIGGKDSMSGSFESLHVPPTLVAFAVATANAADIISPEFKTAGANVALIAPEYSENGLPDTASQKQCFELVSKLIRERSVKSAYAVTHGGVAEGIFKMCLGNRIGFAFDTAFSLESAFDYCYGAFIVELAQGVSAGEIIGRTTADFTISAGVQTVKLDELNAIYEGTLETVYPSYIRQNGQGVQKPSYTAKRRARPKTSFAAPRVLIPVFPGTNCEYDTANAFIKAGAVPDILPIKNLTPADFSESVDRFVKLAGNSQIIMLPGGFSAGDEPDGSGKFITAFFRNPFVAEQVNKLLNERDGLMGGICNGFQALIKLGLVPFGSMREMDASCPTLTFNAIGRHQSRLVRVRIASNKSPWLMHSNVDDGYTVPISHGEGRFVCSDALLKELIANGQIATQYVDINGEPSMDIAVNPNGSAMAVEGITSPDGRIFGKMGHSERSGMHLYKNVDGVKDDKIFKGAVDYFRL